MKDIKELIALAKSKPISEDNLYEDLNEAERFVIAFNIQPGRHKIRAISIYNAYLQWSKSPIHKNPFFKQLAKIVMATKQYNKVIYNLNQSYIDLTIMLKEKKDKK